MNLIALPPEILDLVASHMREKENLLKLALTHSVLFNVVIPRHLYREISLHLPDPTLWTHLLSDLQRLRSIRNLHLVSYATWYVSGHLVLAKEGGSLYKAIAEMPGLKRLTVRHGPNPSNFQSKAFDELLWGTLLRHCLALEDLCFSGGWNCLNCYEAAFGKSQHNFWALSALASIDLNLRCSPGGGRKPHKYDFSPVQDMLLRCPTLKRLSLTYDDTHCNLLEIPEFPSLRFSHLEILRLVSIAFGVTTASLLSSFISANPSIIDLQYLPSADLFLEPTLSPCSMAVLNCLTSLEGSLKTCERLAGAAAPIKLKHLSITLETGEFGPLMDFMCWPGSFLQKLYLYFRDRGQFNWVLLTDRIRSSCPHLEWLSIQQPKSYGHLDSSIFLSISDVASTLTGYPKLSVFDIPWFISVSCGLAYYHDFDANRAQTRETVFGMELKWPRFIRTTDSGETFIVVFGPDLTELEKEDLKIKIIGQVDEQKSGRMENWTAWRYDRWAYHKA